MIGHQIILSRDDCWEWPGATNDKGYPQVRRNGEVVYLHRFISGAGEGEVAMHLCDNPRCINPRHLTAGTIQDNALDAAAKGRLRALFLPQQVREIRNRYRNGEKQKELAEEFGVRQQTICYMVNHKTYKWVQP